MPDFKIKLFPTKELKFRLIDGKAETLERFSRRTEKSENLTSQFTEKSFRGLINENEFKVISSVIGAGTFCVMTGQIDLNGGNVSVEIHKAFRVSFIIIFFLLIIGNIGMVVIKLEEFSSAMVLILVGQILIIRYIIMEFAFRLLSRRSLHRLRKILNIEWIKNK